MKLQFEYEDKIIEFTVIKRKRKSICIRIEENGDITIITPLKISEYDIVDVVKSKIKWIIIKQDKIQKKVSKKIIREIKEGSRFIYVGEEYPLHIIYDNSLKKISVDLKECKMGGYYKYFVIKTNCKDEDRIRLALEQWYRIKTLEIVKKKIQKYSCNFKDKVNEIKVKEQKRRWASCTGKNDILFNWRCSMAREDVIEYIVVHEMCHFDYRNHSKEFWGRVKEIMPDYKEKHEYLKENGMNLYI